MTWMLILIPPPSCSPRFRNRFHDQVHESLGRRKADVIELHQPMSPKMAEIQAAILECMEATLGELRRSNTSVSEVCFALESRLTQA